MIAGPGTSLGAFSLLPAEGLREAQVADATVLSNEPFGDLWRLELRGVGLGRGTQPGQFAMLTIAGGRSERTLPRPMALYEWNDDEIAVVYRIVGAGTADLAEIRTGERLTVVTPLGRPFLAPARNGRVVLLGRGIGCCSLLALAELLVGSGSDVTAVLSGRVPSAVPPAADFRRVGCAEVIVVSDAVGTSDLERLEVLLERGAPRQAPVAIYCCGASRFLSLAARLIEPGLTDIQVSVEAHMACGLGYCHGCASPSTRAEEAPLVCRDGPCFRFEPSPSAADDSHVAGAGGLLGSCAAG